MVNGSLCNCHELQASQTQAALEDALKTVSNLAQIYLTVLCTEKLQRVLKTFESPVVLWCG